MSSPLIGFGHNAAGPPLDVGHDQDLFNPDNNVGRLQNRVVVDNPLQNIHHQRQGQRVVQHLQQAGPSPMFNGGNACFSAAAFVFLFGIEVIQLNYLNLNSIRFFMEGYTIDKAIKETNTVILWRVSK